MSEIEGIRTRVNWLNEARKRKWERCIDETTPHSLFVMGPSRSGKTTLEKLVSKTRGVRPGFENSIVQSAARAAYADAGLFEVPTLAYVPVDAYRSMKKNYLGLLQEVESTSVYTSTVPGSIWDMLFVSRIIPNSRFTFIKRDKKDIAYKMFFRNYKSGNFYSYNLELISEYIDLYYKASSILSDILGEQSVVVDYRDMIARPNEAVSAVLGLCGVDATPIDYEVGNDLDSSIPYLNKLAGM